MEAVSPLLDVLGKCAELGSIPSFGICKDALADLQLAGSTDIAINACELACSTAVTLF